MSLTSVCHSNKILWSKINTRIFSRSMCTPAPQPPPPAQTSNATESISPKFRPSEFQKTLLVWTKMFKNKEEIPSFLAPEVIDKAKSKTRIKLANVFMLLTALASLGAVLSGKAAAKRGESVFQYNQDFHKKYQEEYNKNHPPTK